MFDPIVSRTLKIMHAISSNWLHIFGYPTVITIRISSNFKVPLNCVGVRWGYDT